MKKRVPKRILITGSSQGIGREAAIALARRGDQVVLAARNEAALEEVARTIRTFGGQVSVVPLDVTNPESVRRAAMRILEDGPIDVLVNNAGIYQQSAFLAQDPAFQRAEMDVNYFGPVWVTRAFLPSMITNRSGTIVNVSSLLAAVPAAGVANYSASKAALNAWSHALRGEIEPHGIKVVVFMPSHTDTSNASQSTYEGVYTLPVAYVVKELLRAIDRAPRSTVTSPGFAAFVRLAGLFPAWAERQMVKSTKHVLALKASH